VWTLDIASLYEGTSSQKRSGMARVVEGSHSFICTSMRLSTLGMNHAFALLAEGGPHLPPWRAGRLSWPSSRPSDWLHSTRQ